MLPDSGLCGHVNTGTPFTLQTPSSTLTTPTLTLQTPSLTLATPTLALSSAPLTLALTASSLEEEAYPGVSLLHTAISFEYSPTLDTPATDDALLDSFLQDTDIITMAETLEKDRWQQSLDELFPDLD